MMVYLIIVAEWLGADRYGYIAAAHAATSLTAFLFSWGFNEWMLREGSISPNIELLGGKVIYVKSILGIVWGVLLFLTLRLIRPDLYLDYILTLTIIEVWLDSTFGTLLVIPILKNQVTRASILLVASRLLRLVSVFSLFIFGHISILWILLLRLIATAVIFIVAWGVTRPIFSGICLKNPLRLFRESWVFNASELLNLVFLHVDVNILVWLGADSEQIANYSIVISLINAIITLPSGIYNVLLPSLIRTFNNSKNQFLRSIRKVYLVFGVLGFFLFIGATQLSNPFLTAILGESYNDSIRLMILLSPILGIRAINQSNYAYLITVGWQAKRLLPQVIALLLKIGFGFLAVARYQVIGMVFVSIGSDAVLFAGNIIQVFRHYVDSRSWEYHENINDLV